MLVYFEGVDLRFLPLGLLPLALLSGCAGYAIDYARPKSSIVGPALSRYGLAETQQQCLLKRLGDDLSVWQLRQLAISAEGLKPAPGDTRPLGATDLVWASRHVKDGSLEPQVSRAVAACNIAASAPARAVAPTVAAADQAAPPAAAAAPQDFGKPLANPSTIGAPAPAGTAPAAAGSAPAAAAAIASSSAAAIGATPSWINLGAASTGQQIAVEAASIEERAPYRQAWFRLTTPGAASRSAASYLLRIDCAKKTINSMGLRRHGAAGEVLERIDYGANGEGEAPIESGTVTEIAFLALCT